MINIDFLFLVEHDDREMSTIKRLKRLLEHKNYKCVILSTEFHAHLFNKYRAKNIVFPYAINDVTWPIRAFKRKEFENSNFISLNWEQLLSEANKEFKKPKSSLIQKDFFHLAWDESFKEFLMANNVKEERIRVIGNPLHELLFEDLKNADKYEKTLRADFGLGPSSDIYFFPMNYGWAFFNDEKINAKIKMGYQKEVAHEYREYSRLCLDSFIQFIVKLCSAYRDSIFVLRPHPSISVEQYTNKFKENGCSIPDNLLLTKKYTIKEWIAISKVIGSSWSTSVWDAKKIGKNVFLYTPLERPRWLETFWNSQVANISDYEEFDRVLMEQVAEESDVGEITKSIVFWLSQIAAARPNRKNFTLDIHQRVTNHIYKFRARARSFSMEHLKGAGVGKGLQRDFFLPIE